jgi:hypothetical protein
MAMDPWGSAFNAMDMPRRLGAGDRAMQRVIEQRRQPVFAPTHPVVPYLPAHLVPRLTQPQPLNPALLNFQQFLLRRGGF